MKCEQAAEWISAFFDGAAISSQCAAHLSECEECRVRLNEYAEIEAELRRSANLETAALPAIPRWKTQQASTGWLAAWKKTMRIPRFAFAGMVMAIVTLLGGLALVRARTGMDGPALRLTLKPANDENVLHCAIRTREVDGQPGKCAFMAIVKDGVLRVSLQFAKREEDRVLLTIKADFKAQQVVEGTTFNGEFDASEQQYWLESDKLLSVPVKGTGPLEISGEFSDHVPAFEHLPNETLDAGAHEFRVFSPILIKGKEVVVNMTGAAAKQDGNDPAIVLYVPKEGRFIFAPVAFEGATQAKLQVNQISFTLSGRNYLLTTAAPISRADSVWVLQEPKWRPSEQWSPSADDDAGSLSSGSLHQVLTKRAN